MFAVLAADGGDPPDYLAAPGEWIWSSVLVKDAKQETEFYKSLLSYDIYDLASEGGSEDPAQHTFSQATITPAPGSTACPQIPCDVIPTG